MPNKKRISSILLILVTFIILLFKNESYKTNDFSLTILSFNHSKKELTKSPPQLIKNGDKISGEFKAKENNLGILKTHFIGEFGLNNHDQLVFRLRKKWEKRWYYEKEYTTNFFQPDQYFAFGFPPIPDSKGNTYQFEIEYKKSALGSPLTVGMDEPAFIAKYKIPKSEILKNFIFPHIFKKLFYSFDIYTFIFIILISPLLIPLFSFKSFSFLIPPFIFLFIATVASYFSLFGIDPQHDGAILKSAIDVLEGKILFKETFTQYGAATTLLNAFALGVFGKHLLVIRLLTAFFYALIALVLYLLAKRFLPPIIALLSVAIWFGLSPYFIWVFMPWPSVYALLFQLLSCYFLFKYIENKKSSQIFLSGAMVSLTFWFKQNVGLYIFGAFFLIFILSLIYYRKAFLYKYLKALKFWLAGFLLVNLIFFFWLIANQSLGQWFHQSIYLSFAFGYDVGKEYNPNFILKLLLAIGQNNLWFQIPFIVMLVIGLNLNKINTKIFILSIVSIFSWFQYFPVLESWHIYWAISPMVILVVYFFWYLSGKISLKLISKKYTSFFTLFLFILFMYSLFYSMVKTRLQISLMKSGRPYKTITYPRILTNLKVTANEEIMYREIAYTIDEYTRKYPTRGMVTTTNDSIFLTFIKNNPKFHPLSFEYGLFTSKIFPEYHRNLKNFLIKNKPIVISYLNEKIPEFCPLAVDFAFDAYSIQIPCSDIVQ